MTTPLAMHQLLGTREPRFLLAQPDKGSNLHHNNLMPCSIKWSRWRRGLKQQLSEQSKLQKEQAELVLFSHVKMLRGQVKGSSRSSTNSSSSSSENLQCLAHFPSPTLLQQSSLREPNRRRRMLHDMVIRHNLHIHNHRETTPKAKIRMSVNELGSSLSQWKAVNPWYTWLTTPDWPSEMF